jgi:phenylalanyl-tRNA synthetase beta chain
MGQLHPEAAENYDIKGDVYIAVINMDVVSMLAKFDIKYTGVAKFPASTRDLALVCDKDTYVGDIEKVIRKNAGQYLEKLELFDVYEGEQVGEGKKSVAFSLSFRSIDHTLKDEEVNPSIDKILRKLSDMGIEIRA